MRRWTVMLVPHGQGNTRSLNICAYQLWAFVAVTSFLAFSSAFFFQRYRCVREDMSQLRAQSRQQLEQASVAGQVSPVATSEALPGEERAKLERAIRAEFEARDAAITARLSEVYDLERKIRKIHDIPSLSKTAAGYLNSGSGKEALGGGPTKAEDGGKGGPAGDMGREANLGRRGDDMTRPPEVIYGLARPSADLILQEITLRTSSLKHLLKAMETQLESIERKPTDWPIRGVHYRITSGFEYRRDPFGAGIRHHDGLDISAPAGTQVTSAGRGVVVYSGYDGDYGQEVVIDHGEGIATVYAHLESRLVTEGTRVDRRTPIGRVGMTGRTTGPHLHFEVRLRGVCQDPERYVGN